MNPVQTSVSDYPAKAIAGMWGGGPLEGRKVWSRFAEVGLHAGLVCVPGTTQGLVRAPTAITQVTTANIADGGVVLHQHMQAAGDTYLYDVNDTVNVARYGRIWMITETALAKGANPFVRCVVAGAELAGALRNDADGTDAAQATWLRVVDAVTDAGLVEVEILL